MAENTTGEIEDEVEAIREGLGQPALWLKRIERAKEDEKSWREAAKGAVRVYEADTDKESGELPSFNILHSNIETTVPALYNSTPIPDIRKRFNDPDPAAKLVVDISERAISYTIDEYPFDDTITECVRDGELAGRGCVRVRYEPDVGPDGMPGYQRVTCEHVVWDRWCHGPARTWGEVPWVAFEHDYTKDDLKALGVAPELLVDLSFSEAKEERNSDTAVDRENKGILKTIRVYECWDKRTRAVFWVTEQQKDEFLAVKPDPLQLEAFFPLPQPYLPLRTRKDLTPICPYTIYQPLVTELDKVTRRIAALIGQLRVRGLIDARIAPDLERLKFAEDGHYEPADDAAVFAQGGGGLERAVAHWPMQETIAALQQLYVQREQVKQTIYEVTGLSDVLRGATNPNETLGAQQLKAQVGSQRLSRRQSGVARFVRDLLRMKIEIICNHFTTQNLVAITGIQEVPQVEQLLRNDLLRSYKIDIETDSTIRADVARTQEQMSLFLQGTAQFASSMASVIQLEPGAKAAIVEIYAAFARQFKLGRSAEDALSSMAEAAQQPQEPQPDPNEQAMEMEKQQMQMEAEREQAKAAVEMQLKQMDMQIKQLELQVKQQLAEISIAKAEADLQVKRESMAMDQQAKVFDMKARQMETGAPQ